MKYNKKIIFIVFIFLHCIVFYIFLTANPIPSLFLSWEKWSSIQQLFFIDIRIPKLILAYCVGTGLSIAGVITQGLFRNPLASPDILGVSSGAVLGIVIAIVLGIDLHISLWYYLASSIPSILIIILFFGIVASIKDYTIFILIGFALSIFISSISTILLTTQIHDYNLQLKVSEWLFGSLEGKNWNHIYILATSILFCFLLSLFIIKDLDLLVLGEEIAKTSGANPKKYYILSTTIIGILTGVITGTVGIIGLLGLIVPHLAKLIFGYKNHIQLLITSACIGGLCMVLIEMASRSISNVYIPPGSITNLLGLPFFIHLIIKNFKKRDV